MNTCRKTDQANEDVIAIYIQGHDLFGQRQAEKYNDALEAAFQRIAAWPHLVRLRTEINPPVRIYPHKAHVIVYEEESAGIVILRVRHARENWIDDPLGVVLPESDTP